MVALCDHNSAENVEAAIRAGSSMGIHVFPGMEINSREEVHILSIFDDASQALAMQEMVYGSLSGTNRPEFFGDQVIANEFDEIEGFSDRFLLGALSSGIEQIVREIHGLGGLCIASHVDRPSYSILGQLGFVPPEVDLDAVEISDPAWARAEGSAVLEKLGLPVLTSSDAHRLSDIGRRVTRFRMEAPTVNEVRLALQGRWGRALEM